MADALFKAALSCIWLMLTYHMILGLGGYLHSQRYREPIQEWEAKGLPLPKVTVLIPATTRKWSSPAPYARWPDSSIRKIALK